MYTYRCSVLRSSKKSILIRFNFSFNPVHLARPITSTTYKQGKVFSKQVSIQNAVFLPRHLCQNQNVRTMLWYFLYFFYYEFPMREVGGAPGKLMFYNRCKYVSCTTRPNKPLGIMLVCILVALWLHTLPATVTNKPMAKTASFRLSTRSEFTY